MYDLIAEYKRVDFEMKRDRILQRSTFDETIDKYVKKKAQLLGKMSKEELNELMKDACGYEKTVLQEFLNRA